MFTIYSHSVLTKACFEVFKDSLGLVDSKMFKVEDGKGLDWVRCVHSHLAPVRPASKRLLLTRLRKARGKLLRYY